MGYPVRHERATLSGSACHASRSSNLGPMDSSWVSAGAALLSVLFAAISLWMSRLSKSARSAAEDAESRAARRVEAAESTAAELRRLVDRLSSPALTGETDKTKSGQIIWVTNTTDEPVVVSEVLNRPDFLRLDLEDDLPLTIPGRAHTKMTASISAQFPVPSNLHLRLGDGEESHVALRPRS